MTDRYLKFILTVIACELLWIGIRDAGPRVAAQEKPTPVVITGFRIGTSEFTTLPVAVVGSWRSSPGFRETSWLEPLKIAVTEPIRIDARQPLTVQTGTRPLIVESVPARPGARPGL